MLATEPYKAGQLNEAVAAALTDVKSNPTDVDRRGLLCEMLCFTGDLERADKQLDTISNQNPEAAAGIALFRQLVRAETARQEVFGEGRAPEFLSEPSESLKKHVEALIALRGGDVATASARLAEAEEARPKFGAVCDGVAIDDFRDFDDATGSFFEVLTSTGKYYWIPYENVASVEFHPAKRPRDVLWRQAHMTVRGGPDGEVYIAGVYAGSHASDDDEVRLGRVAAFPDVPEGQPVRGLGVRMFLAGDEAKDIHHIESIEFNAE